MITIEKIKLHNFKRFKDLVFDVNPDINIFIGNNESGKSTILQLVSTNFSTLRLFVNI